MSEKNLPIKLVLQKASDTQKNQGGGSIKFFCDVTQELQNVITENLKVFCPTMKAYFKRAS